MDVPKTGTILKFAAVGAIAAVAAIVVPKFLPSVNGAMLGILLVVIGAVVLVVLKGSAFIGGGFVAAGAIVLANKYIVPAVNGAIGA